MDNLLLAKRLAVCFFNPFTSIMGSITFSITVKEPNRAPDWKETPMVRLSMARRDWEAVTTLTPSITISPPAGSWMPIMCFKRVDLPQPDPPAIMNISPAAP
jgi:hypothetical protein